MVERQCNQRFPILGLGHYQATHPLDLGEWRHSLVIATHDLGCVGKKIRVYLVVRCECGFQELLASLRSLEPREGLDENGVVPGTEVAVVEEACQALGAMIGVIVNGLNPEVVVVTGGVAASLVPLETQVLRAAGEFAFSRALAQTRVRILRGEKGFTVRGGAALVLYETASRRERREP